MIESKQGIERRVYPRVPRNLFMRVKIKDAPSSRWDAPLMKNISLAGCYFHSAMIYQEGQYLDIEIQLPTLKDLFNCTGLIRRIEDHKKGTMSYAGVGVEFVSLEQTFKDRLQEVINFSMARQQDNKK